MPITIIRLLNSQKHALLGVSYALQLRWILFVVCSCPCQAEPRHTEILGYLLYAAKIVAEKEGILDGFRVVINNGPAGCKLSFHTI